MVLSYYWQSQVYSQEAQKVDIKNKNSVLWWQCKKKKIWNRNINWKSSKVLLVNICVWFTCGSMLNELIQCSRIYKIGFGYFVFEYTQGSARTHLFSLIPWCHSWRFFLWYVSIVEVKCGIQSNSNPNMYNPVGLSSVWSQWFVYFNTCRPLVHT